MKLTISSLPPSTNQLERMHWAVKKRMRSSFAWELVAALGETDMRLPPLLIGPKAPKRRIAITIYRPRLLDDDNCAGGLKPLLDAMRDLGLLRNDSPKWMDLVKPVQYVSKDNQRTEILIEDLG